MKKVSENEVTIVSKYPIVVEYKNKEYICLRDSKYCSYDEVPSNSFEVEFSKRIIPNICHTLTFVPKY